jgi:hypothetical protein
MGYRNGGGWARRPEHLFSAQTGPMTGYQGQRQVMAGSRSGTKINSSDPPLTTVCTAYTAQPLLALLSPPIELAGSRPHGRLHLDRRIDFSAICVSDLLEVTVPEIYAD